MGWATFWTIFSQTRLVTLVWNTGTGTTFRNKSELENFVRHRVPAFPVQKGLAALSSTLPPVTANARGSRGSSFYVSLY
jgi:hypothetical protein